MNRSPYEGRAGTVPFSSYFSEGWVLEKTVSKAERARFLERRERRMKPESERDFLAGEIPRVF